MQIEQQVRAVGQQQAALDVDALPRQRLQLLKHGRQVDHHAVADDVVRVLVQHARGNEVQLVLGSRLVVDGVARVGAALRSGC